MRPVSCQSVSCQRSLSVRFWFLAIGRLSNGDSLAWSLDVAGPGRPIAWLPLISCGEIGTVWAARRPIQSLFHRNLGVDGVANLGRGYFDYPASGVVKIAPSQISYPWLLRR